jgi:hypothetical protein
MLVIPATCSGYRCRTTLNAPGPVSSGHGLSAAAATDAAATLDLPQTLTKRGCIVYATKAA